MLEVGPIDAFYGQSHILHGVGLRLEEGARLSVLGRNGAGKSTLMKSIVNAGPKVRGEVRFRGRSLDGLQANQRSRLGLSLVPEDRRIFGHLTSLENLRVAQSGACTDRPLPDLEDVLRRFPMLVPLRDRPGSQMSGGQQQLLAVARAIAARPHVLLLDEPTEGLAPIIVAELAEEVVSCCEAFGVSLLLAEQSVWFARHCTTHVLVLDTGRVVFSGSWQEFDLASDRIQRHLTF
jgi:branched-chain amino acid transport system ATP-binding protein